MSCAVSIDFLRVNSPRNRPDPCYTARKSVTTGTAHACQPLPPLRLSHTSDGIKNSGVFGKHHLTTVTIGKRGDVAVSADVQIRIALSGFLLHSPRRGLVANAEEGSLLRPRAEEQLQLRRGWLSRVWDDAKNGYNSGWNALGESAEEVALASKGAHYWHERRVALVNGSAQDVTRTGRPGLFYPITNS